MDEKLTYREHVQRMVDKCSKVINIMRCLTGSNWGAGRAMLLMIYKAMIRSVFDYGCVVYGSAAQSTLAKLDIVQARALRICTGATKLTPVRALLVEAGETPLSLRRKKLVVNYIVKLKGFGKLLLSASVLEESWEFRQGVKKYIRNSFLHCVKGGIRELDFHSVEIVSPVPWPGVPPWLWHEPDVDLFNK